MKIAIFTDVFLPKYDGVVTSTLNLIKGLADKGHKVLVIAPRYGTGPEFRYSNVEVIRVPSIPLFIYEGLRLTAPFSFHLMKRLRKERVDLIHYTVPSTLAMQAIAIGKFLKLPIVGTFHTFFADESYLKHARLNFRFVQKLAWMYSRAFYNRCDIITCPSENTKKELLSHKFKSVDVISNGIDFKKINNKKWRSVKKKYNSEGDILLFVGRISHEKNILFLIDSFSRVLEKLPKTKLLIVGDGPQEQLVKKHVLKLGIEDKVTFTGKIENETLLKSSIFGASSLFVTASLTENQPMTILESQAGGLVCVAFDARGMGNLIKSGYNGYLAKAGDIDDFVNRMVVLLSDKRLLKKMKSNTLNEIRKHSLSNVITLWEKEYRKLVSPRDNAKSRIR